MTTVGTEKSGTDAEPASSASDAERLQLLGQQTAERLGPVTVARMSSVRWGRTVNIGNYESVRLDVEAVVYTDGEAESTLDWCKRWVDDHLPPDQSERDDAFYERQRLMADIEALKDEKSRGVLVVNQLRAFFKANGLTFPEKYGEDLPF